jgi:hypothetical protein
MVFIFSGNSSQQAIRNRVINVDLNHSDGVAMNLLVTLFSNRLQAMFKLLIGGHSNYSIIDLNARQMATRGALSALKIIDIGIV